LNFKYDIPEVFDIYNVSDNKFRNSSFRIVCHSELQFDYRYITEYKKSEIHWKKIITDWQRNINLNKNYQTSHYNKIEEMFNSHQNKIDRLPLLLWPINTEQDKKRLGDIIKGHYTNCFVYKLNGINMYTLHFLYNVLH